jgi:uncharacterized membrane protein
MAGNLVLVGSSARRPVRCPESMFTRLVSETSAGRGRARPGPTLAALLIMAAFGGAAAVLTGLLYRWSYAPLVGWGIAALAFELRAWIIVGGMDAEQTRAHATVEDPSRAVSDVLVTGANLASLAAVGYVIIDSGRASGPVERVMLAALALLSVAVSWVLVQTLYTLRYARLYYGDTPGGIEFNSPDPPAYVDFAYLAFTMGMTYQVSDTNLQSTAFRSIVLRHGLLSYVFGSVVLATTINLVVGLSNTRT